MVTGLSLGLEEMVKEWWPKGEGVKTRGVSAAGRADYDGDGAYDDWSCIEKREGVERRRNDRGGQGRRERKSPCRRRILGLVGEVREWW